MFLLLYLDLAFRLLFLLGFSPRDVSFMPRLFVPPIILWSFHFIHLNRWSFSLQTFILCCFLVAFCLQLLSLLHWFLTLFLNLDIWFSFWFDLLKHNFLKGPPYCILIAFLQHSDCSPSREPTIWDMLNILRDLLLFFILLSFNKACLVAERFSNKYGLDYVENFALVAKTTTICTLFVIACIHHWDIFEIDVTNA